MNKDDTKGLLERGTLVKCMGRGGVVVASSPSVPEDVERTSGDACQAPA